VDGFQLRYQWFGLQYDKLSTRWPGNWQKMLHDSRGESRESLHNYSLQKCSRFDQNVHAIQTASRGRTMSPTKSADRQRGDC